MAKSKKNTIGEFSFISQYMRPLTMGYKGALQLQDDIAIFPKDKTTDYIVTLDTIVEGVHFLSSATPQQIAAKLLGSNLSDIASCGGTPRFYMLTGNLPKGMGHEWLRLFSTEAAKIQKQYGLILLGGDTVRAEGKKFFSATVIGEVPKGKALLRSKAEVGDDIYVSGCIGEAWLGLQILQGKIKHKRSKYYIGKHYAPTPQIELGRQLTSLATACTDVSDGLLKDLSNICNTSNVSAVLDAENIPLALKEPKYLIPQITGGDDYQLVFTAKPRHAAKIRKLKCTRIGKIVANSKNDKIMVLNRQGKNIKIKRLGYEH